VVGPHANPTQPAYCGKLVSTRMTGSAALASDASVPPAAKSDRLDAAADAAMLIFNTGTAPNTCSALSDRGLGQRNPVVRPKIAAFPPSRHSRSSGNPERHQQPSGSGGLRISARKRSFSQLKSDVPAKAPPPGIGFIAMHCALPGTRGMPMDAGWILDTVAVLNTINWQMPSAVALPRNASHGCITLSERLIRSNSPPYNHCGICKSQNPSDDVLACAQTITVALLILSLLTLESTIDSSQLNREPRNARRARRKDHVTALGPESPRCC
jgi:hypothetical protein